jgi:hypothetical protein
MVVLNWNIFNPFPSKEAWNCVFSDLPFQIPFSKYFPQHHIHKQIFNNFSINLHQNAKFPADYPDGMKN